MHRVFNAPAIKYKGNGFYANDQWHPVEENPDDLK
jgi:predicted nucleic acid-binding Zn ribbon protein